MVSWVKETWREVRPNAKWDAIKWVGYTAAAAVIAGVVVLWHKLSWWQLVIAALAFLSGWIVLILVLIRNRHKNKPLIIHYAGWGLGEKRYADVTTILRGYIKGGKVDIPVSIKVFDDPYPGSKKHVLVRYSCGDAQINEVVRH